MLDTPVTSAPNAFAIWTAKVPTPPDAPLIRTFWPGWTLPSSRRSWRAVDADTPTEAACSNVRLAGFSRNWSSVARAYSANAPATHPKTSSPGRRRVTSLPTASTVPATSVPGTRFFGFRSPVARRMMNGEPVMRIQSPTWIDAAWTRTSTSSSPISGLSISCASRTSAEPYRSWTMAFMVGLPWLYGVKWTTPAMYGVKSAMSTPDPTKGSAGRSP